MLGGGWEGQEPDAVRGDGMQGGALSGGCVLCFGRDEGVAVFASDSSLSLMATGKSAVPSSSCDGG